MENETLKTIFVILGSASLLLSFTTLILTVSVFFRKIEEAESKVATPGKQMDGIKRVWGDGLVGRWFRAGHLWMFFVFREIPRIGNYLEQKLGDEKEPVPPSLKLWAIMPVTTFLLFFGLFILSAWFLDL